MSDDNAPAPELPAAVSVRLRVGTLVGATLRVLARNAIAIHVVVLAALAPAIALSLVANTIVDPDPRLAIVWPWFVAATAVFGGYVAMALIAAPIVREVLGESGGETVRPARRLALAMAGACTLRVLGGALLFWVPGIVLGVRLAVAVPVAAVEGLPVPLAAARSRQMVAGSAWVVFGIWLPVFLARWAGVAVATYLLLALRTWSDLELRLCWWASQLLCTAFEVTASAVAYAQLRRAQSATAAGVAARVFD